ncbi:MAG TPA: exodeoxyribonuclease V subunit gamma [Aquimonas sp.]|nr:exodeoxyribonuclease V subunit gamma [Aquimonas sp.]HRF55388.1 exodeoxyribonuclease V subunit gamma [Aquimonas sp.]
MKEPLLTRGLVLYRASRIEALLQPLLTLLDASAPEAVLAPQTLIAAHPGVRQWLQMALAKARGPAGVVANLDILLPASWIEQLQRDYLPSEATASTTAYATGSLRWVLFDLLQTANDPQWQHYLSGDESGLRRYQLAQHLAQRLAQIRVYRPDWLQDWSAGRSVVAGDDGIGALWRSARARLGQPLRAEIWPALRKALRQAPAVTEPLHVFGLTHLPPQDWQVLVTVAETRPVVLYVPDPCREFWGGLQGPRAHWKGLLESALQTGSVAEPEESGHPLLANWGRIGQHFLCQLENSDLQVDERHWQDIDPPSEPVTTLQCVQESIRRHQAELLRRPLRHPSESAPPDDPEVQAWRSVMSDPSLRIHACHTRLRELEVLRDALLDARTADPALAPADIVVMAPDIRAYAALFPAVFGEAGRSQGPLPWQFADVSPQARHPAWQAVSQWLGLARSRCHASELLDWWSLPPVRRGADLNEADIDTCRALLEQARVVWGLDAEAKQRAGAPAKAVHSHAWGLDRALAAYVLGEAQEGDLPSVALADSGGVVPLQGIDPSLATILGQWDSLLSALRDWQDFAEALHPLADWVDRLLRVVDERLMADPSDVDEARAFDALRASISDMLSEAQSVGCEPMLGLDAVTELFEERVQAATAAQRFLRGGMTVCGMVPQRAVPFRVIAVLGLDEGAFPRAVVASHLDLMADHPRLGDRDVRSDDRWLFLQTLMSARDRLHLSYLGQGVRDGKPRNPAEPLADLLDVLDREAGLAPTEGHGPWWVAHPLQPFDARYYDAADPRLFSYRPPLALPTASPPTTPFYRAEQSSLAVTKDARTVLRMDALLSYFRRPAETLLGERLSLHALQSDALPRLEPMQDRLSGLDSVARALFLHWARDPAADLPAHVPPELRLAGRLPLGRAGEAAWQRERFAIEVLRDIARTHPLFADGLPEPRFTSLDFDAAPWHLQGSIGPLYRCADTDWLLILVMPKVKQTGAVLSIERSARSAHFGQRIPVFLQWLLRQLQEPLQPVRVCLLQAEQDDGWTARLDAFNQAWVSAWQRQDAARIASLRQELLSRLHDLLQRYVDAQHGRRWYFPRTSWQAVTKPESKWLTHWQGQGGELHSDGGYAALWSRDIELADDPTAMQALIDLAEDLMQCLWIDPDAVHDAEPELSR